MSAYKGPPLFSGVLRRDDVGSGAEASAKIPRILAQNGLLTKGQHRGTFNMAPPNSRGLFGEDHSGAGYGRPITHTYWAYDALPTSDPTANGVKCSGALGMKWGRIPSGESNLFCDIEINVPVPSCYPGGAYDVATLDVVWRVYTLYSEKSSYGVFLDVMNRQTKSMALFAVDAGYGGTTGYSVESKELRMIPGEVNRVAVRMYTAAAGAHSLVAPIHVRVLSMSFSQADGDDDGE
jgi:hypothetical protein